MRIRKKTLLYSLNLLSSVTNERKFNQCSLYDRYNVCIHGVFLSKVDNFAKPLQFVPFNTFINYICLFSTQTDVSILNNSIVCSFSQSISYFFYLIKN